MMLVDVHRQACADVHATVVQFAKDEVVDVQPDAERVAQFRELVVHRDARVAIASDREIVVVPVRGEDEYASIGLVE